MFYLENRCMLPGKQVHDLPGEQVHDLPGELVHDLTWRTGACLT